MNIEIYTAILPIFFIVFLGLFCFKKNIFNPMQIEGFELVLFKIIMPAYLFIATYQHDLSILFNKTYILAYGLTFISLAIIVGCFIAKGQSISNRAIKILASGYVNAAIYTLPVTLFVLKNPTAAITVNLLQVIIIQPIFIMILSISKHKEKSMWHKIFEMLTTPIISLPLLGVALNYFQVYVPLSLVNGITQIGYGASGFALFVFGLTLGTIKLNRKMMQLDLLSLVFAKNILHPILAFGIAYIMHLERYWFNALILAASSPTAIIIYFIAKQFGVEENLIKKTITLSAMVSMVSLIVITSLIDAFSF